MSMEQQSKPAKKKGLKDIFLNKRLRYGGASALIIAAVVALTVLVNVAISALDNNWNLKADLTANSLYKISHQTENVMKDVSTPVRLVGLFEEGSMDMALELLNRYRALNPNMVTVETVDITKNPAYVNQYKDATESISLGSVIVTNGDGSRYRVVNASDMYQYEFNYTTYTSDIKAFIGEQALTNAVVFVTSENQSRAFFLTGHSETELSTYQYVVSQMEQFNMLVQSIEATNLEELHSGDILVVTSPQRDLSEEEREILKEFLANGGNMIYMRNATDAALERFDSLLALYGVTVQHDLIVDPSSSTSQSPVIIVPEIASHEITQSMSANGLFSVFPYASSFDLPTVDEYSRTVTSLLKSSANSYGKTDLQSETIDMQDGDLAGPRTLGVAITQDQGNGLTTKIAAYGNSYFVTDSSISTYSGNRDLFFNTVRWMQGESTAISIVGKSLVDNRLNFATAAQFWSMAILVVVVIPVVILAVGLVIYLRRRHL